MILCEFGPDGGPCLFRDPDELLVIERPDEVAAALDLLDARRRAAHGSRAICPMSWAMRWNRRWPP